MMARSEDSARLPMRDGLVSIITPAYRCANVVGRTIQSVLDQTYPDWELLIAEDCSPDSTREEIERWTRVRSEEHTSELQSLMRISYAVFCLKKKNKDNRKPEAYTFTPHKTVNTTLNDHNQQC